MTSAPPSGLPADEIASWLAGRLPDGWFGGPPEVTVDRDEILVVGTLDDVRLDKGADAASRAAARRGRIARFREDTREARMRIAEAAEQRYRRKVSWGARCGEETELFTTMGVPVMTRLRLPERAVLDTLVEAGVARSRSDALAWCVKLVGANEGRWIAELRDALVHVEKVRAAGPR